MTGSLRGDVTKEDAGNQNVLLTITWEFCPVDTFLSPVLQLVNTEGQDAIGQENDTRQQSVNVPERREEHSGPSCDLDNVVQDKGVHGKVFDDLLRLARWVLILLPWLGQGDIEEADEDDLTKGVCPDSVRGAEHPRAEEAPESRFCIRDSASSSSGLCLFLLALNSSGGFKRVVPSLNTESPRMTMG